MNQQQQIECVIPVLPVRSVPAAVQFYTQVLGFVCDWGGGPDSRIASVSRDGRAIMLSAQPGAAAPAWVWIGLEDSQLFDAYRARGVRVVQEPRNWSWAYEMKFADLDGNVLWLGTEPRTDLPQLDRAAHA